MSTPSPNALAPPQAGPLVSVILPTHNRQDLLPRAIRSVLGQTYRNLELFVVDDASTDNTAAVVQGFDDPRLHYIRLDKNSRAAAARNAGIKASQGELIAFQDDDDEWLPQKLERQVAALLAAPSEVGLQLCGFMRREPSKESYVGGSFYLDQMNFAGCPAYRDFALISTPNWLLRRSVLERSGLFDERIKSLDDWELGLRILDVTRFAMLDEPLWIQHWSRPEGVGMVRNESLIVNDFPILLEKHSARWTRRTVAQFCFQTGRMHASLGQSRAGLSWLLRAVRSNPFFLKAWVLLFAALGGDRTMRFAISLGRRITWAVRRATFP